jgi:hypothetical protein
MTVTTIENSMLSKAIRLPPQAKVILRHLEKGKDISLIASLHVYQISRLSDCIMKIRRAGYDVLTQMRMTETGKEYASYRLNTRLQLN